MKRPLGAHDTRVFPLTYPDRAQSCALPCLPSVALASLASFRAASGLEALGGGAEIQKRN